jgi:hypothetical protein
LNPENENAHIIDNKHFSYLLIRDYLLGNILGEHTDEILYWAGKDLARQFPLKSQEDLYEAMIYCGFGQLELLKKEKNAQQYRLESDLVTVRTQNEQVSFQLEAERFSHCPHPKRTSLLPTGSRIFSAADPDDDRPPL